MDTVAIIYTILSQCSELILADTKRQIFIKILLYPQVLVARPVRIAFLGKDVILPEFVVCIFIQYVYEMFSLQRKNYIKIKCIILMELPFLTRQILYLKTLAAQPVLIAFLVKDVVLTRFVVSTFID